MKKTTNKDLLNNVAERTAKQIMEVELFNGSGIPLEDINYVFNKEKLHTLKKQGEMGEMIIQNITYVEKMVSEILMKDIGYMYAEGFGWVDDKYDASKHSDYAQDMLEAPIQSVLGSVVFFYQVFRLWIKNSKDYMVRQLMEQGVEKMKAEEVHQVLCTIMDGFTKPNWLPTLRESHLTKHLTYLS
jgi:hypothetical protein